jgi:hypothetical protein
MSNAGSFTVIINDGRQDSLLMAPEYLKERIEEIKKQKRQAGLKNDLPTIKEIEKTHILFTVAHYKPFVTMGFEYYRVSCKTTPTLGGRMEWEIPSYGDFFADMVAHIKLDSGVFTHDANAAKADASQYRWCSYPGERLFKNVEFHINNSKIDSYSREAVVMYRNFKVAPGKKAAWDRCMGQERPQVGMLIEDITELPEVQRAAVNYYDGYQTPKGTHDVDAALGSNHDDLEMFIPILFWFNLDPRLAVASAAIPQGQRTIRVDLATATEMIQLVSRGAGDSATLATPSFLTTDLYINNIFLQSEVHDVFMSRVGFTLIRVHRIQTYQVTTASKEEQLFDLKWPIEYMMVGLRPTANITITSGEQATVNKVMDHWHKFHVVTTGTFALSNIDDQAGAGTGTPSIVTNAVTPTIDNLSLKAHGVQYYTDVPRQFFNQYVPLRYGGANIQAPEDEGLCMITFCLYPGTYQPSGHLNTSRSRETMLKYNSSYVTSSNTADMFVVASALNFFLISDGNGSLRYTT